MADEQAKIDSNYRKTLTGVTDDAAAEIKRLLVDPTTGRLKVSATISGGAFTGSGTIEYLAKWSGGSVLTTSSILDSGGSLSFGSVKLNPLELKSLQTFGFPNSSGTFALLSDITTQSFVVGSSGNQFNISSSGTTHTFNLPTASSSGTGQLTAADWTTFNNKASSEGTVYLGGSGTVNQIAYFSGGSALSSSGSLFWKNTNGFLGINNDTPGALLDIFASSGTAFSVRNAGGTLFVVGANGRISVGSVSSVLEILPNGNVGIGTTGPGAKLDVGGFGTALFGSPTALFADNVNDISGIQMYNANTGSGAEYRFLVADPAKKHYIAFSMASAANTNQVFGRNKGDVATIFTQTASGGTDRDFIIGTHVNTNLMFGTNGIIRTTISNAGNVGIGTSTPNVFKLQVAGNIGPDATTNNLGSVGTPWASVFAGSLSTTSGGTLQGTFLAGTGLTMPAFTVRGIITPANTNDLGSSGSAFGTIFTNNLQINQQAYFDAEYSAGSASAGTTIDWTNGNKQFIGVNQTSTLAFGTPYGPCNLILRTSQENHTGGVITWPTNVRWSGGSALSTGSNQIDIVAFYFDNQFYWGQIATNFTT